MVRMCPPYTLIVDAAAAVGDDLSGSVALTAAPVKTSMTLARVLSRYAGDELEWWWVLCGFALQGCCCHFVSLCTMTTIGAVDWDRHLMSVRINSLKELIV